MVRRGQARLCGLLVLCGFFLAGCVSAPKPIELNLAIPNAPSSKSMACSNDIGTDIGALVNYHPLVMASVKVGSDGSADKWLARSLGVSPSSRQTTSSGLEVPSETETALRSQIMQHPCFASFAEVINEGESDVSGRNRAILQIQMPLAKLQEITVEQIPGKFRKNYLWQLSLSLELRDSKGRVVYTHSHADFLRQSCFWEGGPEDEHRCRKAGGVDIAVDREALWQELLDNGVKELLATINQDLPAWRQLLTMQKGNFLDKRYYEELEFSGTEVIHRDSLTLPYFFVQTPNPQVNITRLTKELKEQAFPMNQAYRADMQLFYDELFRSRLAAELRNKFAQANSVEQARILILSDAQSEAFQNAMLIACAEQSQGFNQDDCLAPVKLIEKLCKGKSSSKSPDSCRLATLYFNKFASKSGKAQGDWSEATQLAGASSFLRTPGRSERTKAVSCYNSVIKKKSPVLMGISDTYFKVSRGESRDDGYYLLDAVNAALDEQVECLATHIVEQYQGMKIKVAKK